MCRTSVSSYQQALAIFPGGVLDLASIERVLIPAISARARRLGRWRYGPMDVWERVLAFADAQAILTAHDRGVFEVLGHESATGPAIAERVQLPVNSCERLLR